MPNEPEITLEERVVLGVLVTGRPQNLRDLHATLERDWGHLVQLNLFELRTILNRLESRGFIRSYDG